MTIPEDPSFDGVDHGVDHYDHAHDEYHDIIEIEDPTHFEESSLRRTGTGPAVIPTPKSHALDQNRPLKNPFITTEIVAPHSYTGSGRNTYPTKGTAVPGPPGFPSISMHFFVDTAHDAIQPTSHVEQYDESGHGEIWDESETDTAAEAPIMVRQQSPTLRTPVRKRKLSSNGWFGVDNVSFDPHGTDVRMPNVDPETEQYVILSHAHSDHVFNQNATVITTDPTWFLASRGQAIYGRQAQALAEQRNARTPGGGDLRRGYFGSSGFRDPMRAGPVGNQKVIIAPLFDDTRPDETRIQLKDKNGEVTGWVEFYPNGHMLGSTMTVYRPAAWSSMEDGKRIPGPGILYTGDFDPNPQSDEITPGITWPKNITHVVMEGTHYKKTNEEIDPADIYDVNKKNLRESLLQSFLVHKDHIDSCMQLPNGHPGKRNESVPMVFGAWALGKSAEEALFWIKNNQRPVVGEDIAFWLKMYDDFFKEKGEQSPFYEMKGSERVPKFDVIEPKSSIKDNANWEQFSKSHFPSFGQFVSEPGTWRSIIRAIEAKYNDVTKQIINPDINSGEPIDTELIDFRRLVQRSGMAPAAQPGIFNLLASMSNPDDIEKFYTTTAGEMQAATSKMYSSEKDLAIAAVNQKEATRQLIRRTAMATYCQLIKDNFKKYTTAGPGQSADIFSSVRPVILSTSLFSADNENKAWNQSISKWWWLTGLGGVDADVSTGYHETTHTSPLVSRDWYRTSKTPPGAARRPALLVGEAAPPPPPGESRRTRFLVTLNRPPTYRPDLAIGSETQFPYSPVGRIPLTAHATPGGTERVVLDILKTIGPNGGAPYAMLTVHANQRKLDLVTLLRQVSMANHIGTNGKMFTDTEMGSGMFYPKVLLNSPAMWESMNPAFRDVLTGYITQYPDSPLISGRAIHPSSGVGARIIERILENGRNNAEIQRVVRSMNPFWTSLVKSLLGSETMFSPPDYTNDFNTDLSQEDERKFQEFAAKNNLLKDLPDYDVRGAWKAIQGGTDPRGYGGFWNDRFKKPNHPLFSTESIYHGTTNEKTGEMYEGGIWEKLEPETESNPYGKYRWTPSHWNLSVYPKEHAEEYWNKVEAGNGHEICIGANQDEHESFVQEAKASLSASLGTEGHEK